MLKNIPSVPISSAFSILWLPIHISVKRLYILTANSLSFVNSNNNQSFSFKADELHADKIFKRTNCHEFEINVYSHETRRIGIIARIYTDSEDGLGYYRAFSLIFKTAEQDMGRKIPWGHLTPMKNGIHRIKAVLIDEHGGQIKGFGRYLEEQDPKKRSEFSCACTD